MRTVKEISQLTGVSVRTLHHYDSIGLLKPTRTTESGYRLYNEDALKRLSAILLYRELDFSLKEIDTLLAMSAQERSNVIREKISELEQRQHRLENRIFLAKNLERFGGINMTEPINTASLDDQEAQVKLLWGKIEAYQEYAEKVKNRSAEESETVNDRLMQLFVQLGSMLDKAPESPEVHAWVAGLQSYISRYYYRCTPQILRGLGQMYADGSSMTDNIDRAGGSGTAELAHHAIEYYCNRI